MRWNKSRWGEPSSHGAGHDLRKESGKKRRLHRKGPGPQCSPEGLGQVGVPEQRRPTGGPCARQKWPRWRTSLFRYQLGASRREDGPSAKAADQVQQQLEVASQLSTLLKRAEWHSVPVKWQEQEEKEPRPGGWVEWNGSLPSNVSTSTGVHTLCLFTAFGFDGLV